MTSPFIGTWRLISQNSVYPDGRVIPSRGENPAGIIMYDSARNIAVQLMRTDAQATTYTDLRTLETALQGYLAYFGRYEVDEAQQVVLHHILGASYPGYVGTTQVRQYEFAGDILTLRAQSPADNSVRVLVWQRLP